MKGMIPIIACVTVSLLGLATVQNHAASDAEPTSQSPASEASMQIQYLEIVTPDVDSLCKAYEQLFGVTFSDPIAELGNARTANLPDGGKLGVRGPLRDTETPVVRPYLLVDDIAAAVKSAEAAGGKIAVPPMELPGQGIFAIYLLGGIEHGLWQR